MHDLAPSWHWVAIVQGDKQWITHFIDSFLAACDNCPPQPTVGLDLLISLHQRSRKDFSNTWQCWQFLKRLSKSVDGCGFFCNRMQGFTGRCPRQSRNLALWSWRCRPRCHPRWALWGRWSWLLSVSGTVCSMARFGLCLQVSIRLLPARLQLNRGACRRKASQNLDKIFKVTPSHNWLHFLTASTAEQSFNSLNFPLDHLTQAQIL